MAIQSLRFSDGKWQMVIGHWPITLALFLFTALSLATPAAADPSISSVTLTRATQGGDLRHRIQIAGLSTAQSIWLDSHRADSAALTSAVQLRTGTDAPADQPQIIALIEPAPDSASLSLTPLFPLRPNQPYTLTLSIPPDPAITLSVVIPADPTLSAPPAAVTAVYPSAVSLPENLLRFYIHFSAPMSQGNGNVYRHIQLLDEHARPIPDVFLELPEELWDPTGRRLTLFFHPGRVKQGLVPNLEMGPTLVAGRSYSLRIADALTDALGRPLAQPFIKPFTATPADQQQPNPASWTILGPRPATTDLLDIHLQQPLDHAMLLRVIQVLDPAGSPIPGHFITADHESRLIFTPDVSWKPGNHTLRIANTLEDPSGNNIVERFELPAAEAGDRASQRGHTDLHFTIAPPAP